MRILVFTEDSSKDALGTLRALIKKLLQFVDAECQTQKLDIEPPDDDLQAIARGNLWKSRKNHQQLVALRRSIATRLAEEPPGFVMFHEDGDRRWSERDQSENRRRFDAEIVAKVRALIESKRGEMSVEQVDRCMSG